MRPRSAISWLALSQFGFNAGVTVLLTVLQSPTVVSSSLPSLPIWECPAVVTMVMQNPTFASFHETVCWIAPEESLATPSTDAALRLWGLVRKFSSSLLLPDISRDALWSGVASRDTASVGQPRLWCSISIRISPLILHYLAAMVDCFLRPSKADDQ